MKNESKHLYKKQAYEPLISSNFGQGICIKTAKEKNAEFSILGVQDRIFFYTLFGTEKIPKTGTFKINLIQYIRFREAKVSSGPFQRDTQAWSTGVNPKNSLADRGIQTYRVNRSLIAKTTRAVAVFSKLFKFFRINRKILLKTKTMYSAIFKHFIGPTLYNNENYRSNYEHPVRKIDRLRFTNEFKLGGLIRDSFFYKNLVKASFIPLKKSGVRGLLKTNKVTKPTVRQFKSLTHDGGPRSFRWIDKGPGRKRALTKQKMDAFNYRRNSWFWGRTHLTPRRYFEFFSFLTRKVAMQRGDFFTSALEKHPTNFSTIRFDKWSTSFSQSWQRRIRWGYTGQTSRYNLLGKGLRNTAQRASIKKQTRNFGFSAGSGGRIGNPLTNKLGQTIARFNTNPFSLIDRSVPRLRKRAELRMFIPQSIKLSPGRGVSIENALFRTVEPFWKKNSITANPSFKDSRAGVQKVILKQLAGWVNSLNSRDKSIRHYKVHGINYTTNYSIKANRRYRYTREIPNLYAIFGWTALLKKIFKNRPKALRLFKISNLPWADPELRPGTGGSLGLSSPIAPTRHRGARLRRFLREERYNTKEFKIKRTRGALKLENSQTLRYGRLKQQKWGLSRKLLRSFRTNFDKIYKTNPYLRFTSFTGQGRTAEKNYRLRIFPKEYRNSFKISKYLHRKIGHSPFFSKQNARLYPMRTRNHRRIYNSYSARRISGAVRAARSIRTFGLLKHTSETQIRVSFFEEARVFKNTTMVILTIGPKAPQETPFGIYWPAWGSVFWDKSNLSTKKGGGISLFSDLVFLENTSSIRSSAPRRTFGISELQCALGVARSRRFVMFDPTIKKYSQFMQNRSNSQRYRSHRSRYRRKTGRHYRFIEHSFRRWFSDHRDDSKLTSQYMNYFELRDKAKSSLIQNTKTLDQKKAFLAFYGVNKHGSSALQKCWLPTPLTRYSDHLSHFMHYVPSRGLGPGRWFNALTGADHDSWYKRRRLQKPSWEYKFFAPTLLKAVALTHILSPKFNVAEDYGSRATFSVENIDRIANYKHRGYWNKVYLKSVIRNQRRNRRRKYKSGGTFLRASTFPRRFFFRYGNSSGKRLSRKIRAEGSFLAINLFFGFFSPKILLAPISNAPRIGAFTRTRSGLDRMPNFIGSHFWVQRKNQALQRIKTKNTSSIRKSLTRVTGAHKTEGYGQVHSLRIPILSDIVAPRLFLGNKPHGRWEKLNRHWFGPDFKNDAKFATFESLDLFHIDRDARFVFKRHQRDRFREKNWKRISRRGKAVRKKLYSRWFNAYPKFSFFDARKTPYEQRVLLSTRSVPDSKNIRGLRFFNNTDKTSKKAEKYYYPRRTLTEFRTIGRGWKRYDQDIIRRRTSSQRTLKKILKNENHNF